MDGWIKSGPTGYGTQSPRLKLARDTQPSRNLRLLRDKSVALRLIGRSNESRINIMKFNDFYRRKKLIYHFGHILHPVWTNEWEPSGCSSLSRCTLLRKCFYRNFVKFYYCFCLLNVLSCKHDEYDGLTFGFEACDVCRWLCFWVLDLEGLLSFRVSLSMWH